MIYNGLPVFIFIPVDEIAGAVKTNNIIVGKPNNLRSLYNIGLYRTTITMSFLCDTPTMFNLKTFFIAQMGQSLPFYLVSFQRDLTISQPSAINTSSINVYSYNQNYYKTNYIYFSKSQQIAKITGAAYNSATLDYTLSLDTTITIATAIGDWLQNVYYVRFDSDTFTAVFKETNWEVKLDFIEVLQ